jgi:hypothetical protein
MCIKYNFNFSQQIFRQFVLSEIFVGSKKTSVFWRKHSALPTVQCICCKFNVSISMLVTVTSKGQCREMNIFS